MTSSSLIHGPCGGIIGYEITFQQPQLKEKSVIWFRGYNRNWMSIAEAVLSSNQDWPRSLQEAKNRKVDLYESFSCTLNGIACEMDLLELASLIRDPQKITDLAEERPLAKLPSVSMMLEDSLIPYKRDAILKYYFCRALETDSSIFGESNFFGQFIFDFRQYINLEGVWKWSKTTTSNQVIQKIYQTIKKGWEESLASHIAIRDLRSIVIGYLVLDPNKSEEEYRLSRLRSRSGYRQISHTG